MTGASDTSNATLSAPDTTNTTPKAPNTTKERFDLVARGTLDPERASQLLGEICDAQDYLAVLSEYSEAQQYIDALDKVYSYFFLQITLSLNPC